MLKQCHPVRSPFQEAKTLGRGHEGASNATRKINILIKKKKHPSLIPNVHYLKNKNKKKQKPNPSESRKRVRGSSRWSLDSPTPLEGKRKGAAEREEERNAERDS